MQLHHNYLTLSLPDGWEDASQVIALGPEEDGFRPNLVFSQEPTKPGETVEEFAARQLAPLREALDGYSLRREEVRQLGPNTGFLRQHEFHMEKGEIGQLQFYMVLRGRCYTFTFTHLRHRFDRARETAEQLIARARISLGPVDQDDEGEDDE